MRIVQARFHSLGTDPVDQAVRIISDKSVRRKGHNNNNNNNNNNKNNTLNPSKDNIFNISYDIF